MESRSQLLCTFSTLGGYPKDIDSIIGLYEILNSSIFVLQNMTNTSEVFLTYNIENQYTTRHQKTISVHRKKDANVLYSINALNKLVESELKSEENSRIVDWSKYKNSLIISVDDELKIIPTKLLTIFRV